MANWFNKTWQSPFSPPSSRDTSKLTPVGTPFGTYGRPETYAIPYDTPTLPKNTGGTTPPRGDTYANPDYAPATPLRPGPPLPRDTSGLQLATTPEPYTQPETYAVPYRHPWTPPGFAPIQADRQGRLRNIQDLINMILSRR